MARLYTNENFPQPAVHELRRLGHDVLTTHEAHNSNAAISDDDVVRFAAAANRIVVTLNKRDFIRIHRRSQAHSGIIVCTVDGDFVALAQRVDAALRASDSARGELLRVSRAAPGRRPASLARDSSPPDN